ncbi:hypothetical protein CC79DRAFT_822227 [Sarocladium strictum]
MGIAILIASQVALRTVLHCAYALIVNHLQYFSDQMRTYATRCFIIVPHATAFILPLRVANTSISMGISLM